LAFLDDVNDTIAMRIWIPVSMLSLLIHFCAILSENLLGAEHVFRIQRASFFDKSSFWDSLRISNSQHRRILGAFRKGAAHRTVRSDRSALGRSAPRLIKMSATNKNYSGAQKNWAQKISRSSFVRAISSPG